MLFNTFSYAIFLPIVFLLYWFVVNKSLKLQNLLLLAASYFFYSCWDWRFLFLLIFSTFLDFFTGIRMVEAKTKNYKKFWFWLSIIINLGFLGVFKYYNFFISSFADLSAQFGMEVNPWTIKVILPVGISFYTFHGLSYVIDIYFGKIKAERDFVEYSVFVSYFPLLVAGPIERATHLLPQIQKKRYFDYHKAIDGLKQILWGLFKKVVIADQCAEYANLIFNNSDTYSGTTLVLGALLFTFQIYGDFSGYSDIALGTSRLFGIELLRNFSFPYFSRDIAEFWRRWHISLSSWFRDYLYIPLGGSQGSLIKKIRNTMLIFLVSGFWHGANWTFIAWGALNALYFIPLLITGKNRNNLSVVAQGKCFPTFRELYSMLLTFSLTVFAWIFFRAESIGHALGYIKNMFLGMFSRESIVKTAHFFIYDINPFLILFLIFFFLIEWLGREQEYGLAKIGISWNKAFRWFFFYLLAMAVLLFAGKEQQFIYFQF